MSLTESWPLDKAGKAAELGTKHSGFGVTGRFLFPFKATSVDFRKGGSYLADSS